MLEFAGQQICRGLNDASVLQYLIFFISVWQVSGVEHAARFIAFHGQLDMLLLSFGDALFYW